MRMIPLLAVALVAGFAAPAGAVQLKNSAAAPVAARPVFIAKTPSANVPKTAAPIFVARPTSVSVPRAANPIFVARPTSVATPAARTGTVINPTNSTYFKGASDTARSNRTAIGAPIASGPVLGAPIARPPIARPPIGTPIATKPTGVWSSPVSAGGDGWTTNGGISVDASGQRYGIGNQVR